MYETITGSWRDVRILASALPLCGMCPWPAPLPSLCFPVFTCESYLVIRKLSSGPDDPMVTRTSPYRARPPLQLLKENRNECSVLVHTLPGRWGSPRERWSCSSRPQGTARDCEVLTISAGLWLPSEDPRLQACRVTLLQPQWTREALLLVSVMSAATQCPFHAGGGGGL